MTRRDVTNFELELLLDGELADEVGEERAAKIAALVDSDGEIASRFAAIERGEMLIERALTRSSGTGNRRDGFGLTLAPIGFGIACLGMLVVTLIAWRGSSASPDAAAPAPNIAIESMEREITPQASADRAMTRRVMFDAPADRFDLIFEAPTQGSVGVSEPERSLQDLLASGNTKGVADMLASADSETRRALAGEMAEMLQSTRTLRDALEALPADARVEVCVEWLDDPRFRAATLAELRRLRDDPAFTDDVNRAVETLKDDRTLAAWLQSYGLVTND